MEDWIRRVRAGEIEGSAALAELRRSQLEELAGAAQLDVARERRRGIPEVVLAEGKGPDDAAQLAVRLATERGQALVSRLAEAHWTALRGAVAGAGLELVEHRRAARVTWRGWTPPPAGGRAAILTAGTSDLDAAEEARMVIAACGHEVRLRADLGVAGLHRLLTPLAELQEWDPDVIVVAAGMDGVLPGIVAGLVAVPVIGLPVSTGYGRGGGGRGALTTMLQSCAGGLTVVNIDNGVGAGQAAVLVANRAGALRG
ncbi:MAG: nickel pincer cofactor biosynthesis protein LarB [Candidatus Dormibacteraceae bacterium]